MHAKTVELRVRRPFSLKATVLSHGWHECAPMSWNEGGRCFQMVERLGRGVYRVSTTEGRKTAKMVTLSVSVEGGDVDEAVASAMRDRIRFVLNLDQDLSDFYGLCGDHPTLHVLPRIGAGRLLRSASMAENIVKAICATNVNWTQAVKMINRIGQLGPIVPHFRSLNAWPTPREILRAGTSYLDEVCRLGYRTPSILSFCDDVCKGRMDPEQLWHDAADGANGNGELLARLRSVRGIGPSSASYLLGFLRRHDRLSIDSGNLSFLARLHGLRGKPSIKRLERIYEPYGPWRGLVCWFEFWLTWGTARELMREAGIEPPGDR